MPVVITHLEITPADWARCGVAPSLAVTVTRERFPRVAFYRDLYDAVGRPWLWYERRLMSDGALAELLARPGHELHVARHGANLVGYFELDGPELSFFGLTPTYIGRGLGSWLLDLAVGRAFAAGARKLSLNTNNLDHPRALAVYRKAGFRAVRSESVELRDPRVLWPDVYRWPPR